MRPRIAKFPRSVSSSRLIVGSSSEPTCSLLPVRGKPLDLVPLVRSHGFSQENDKRVTNHNPEVCARSKYLFSGTWRFFFFFRIRWNIAARDVFLDAEACALKTPGLMYCRAQVQMRRVSCVHRIHALPSASAIHGRLAEMPEKNFSLSLDFFHALSLMSPHVVSSFSLLFHLLP